MEAIQVRPGVYWVGVNDRTTDLFESVWPLPRGVSYNSYLIIDQKTVLIDVVKQGFSGQLLAMIEAEVDPSKISFIVINHMEPDHSGTIRALRRAAPDDHPGDGEDQRDAGPVLRHKRGC